MKKIIFNPNNKNILTIVDSETRKIINSMKRVGIYQNIIDTLNNDKYKKIEDDLTKESLEELILRFLEGLFDTNMLSHKDYTELSQFIDISRIKIAKHFNSNNYKAVIILLIDYKIIETDNKYYFDNKNNFKYLGYKLSERFINNIHKENYKMYNRMSDVNLKDFDTHTSSIYETYTTDLLRNSISFDEKSVRNYLMNDMKVSYQLLSLEDFKNLRVFDYEISIKVECMISDVDLKELNKLRKTHNYTITAKSFESKIKFNKEQLHYLLREADLFDIDCIENELMIIGKEYRIVVRGDINKVDNIYKSCLISNININANRYNKIQRGSVYANVNDTNNRLDSSFTVLHRGIRQFIKINNKKVFNIDIVNSQFTILANLLKGNLKHLICKYTGYKFEYKDYIKYPDVQLFIKEAISGNFYEKICEIVYEEAYTEATDDVKKILRNDMKITCYGILFSQPTYHRKSNDNFNIFNSHFPNLVAILDTFQEYQQQFEKQRFNNKGERLKGKGALANTLCRLESDIMIKQLFRTKLENKKSVLMIHDGLYAPVNEQESIINDVITIFKENNLEATLTLNGKMIKEDLKPLYELRNIKKIDVKPQQYKAYQLLKKENLNEFMLKTKKEQSKLLNIKDIRTTTKLLKIVLK